jgi:hypothetical protein
VREGAAQAIDNFGHGWHYDAAGETGLRLRVERPDYRPFVGGLLVQAELHYHDVAGCMGFDATPPGPLVILVAALPEGVCGRCAGFTYLETGTTVVTGLGRSYPHELVHYLLERRGFPRDRNRAHDHPAFDAFG